MSTTPPTSARPDIDAIRAHNDKAAKLLSEFIFQLRPLYDATRCTDGEWFIEEELCDEQNYLEALKMTFDQCLGFDCDAQVVNQRALLDYIERLERERVTDFERGVEMAMKRADDEGWTKGWLDAYRKSKQEADKLC